MENGDFILCFTYTGRIVILDECYFKDIISKKSNKKINLTNIRFSNNYDEN